MLELDLEQVVAVATRRLQKARIQMLVSPDPATKKYPFIFWATAALRLGLRPIPHMGKLAGGHIGTDGVDIVFDPFVYANPKKSELSIMSDVAHETSHCVKGDIWRVGARDRRVFNIAADMRIDPELIKAGFEGPDHGSPQANAKFHNPANYGRSAEAIYKELVEESQGGEGEGQGPGSGDGQGNDPLSADILDPAAGAKDPAEAAQIREDLARRWELIARQAAEIAKSQGVLPEGYEHLIRPIKPALNPWDLIKHYVSMCRKDDYSWGRLNRRSLYRGLAMPGLLSEGIGTLLIGMDTSGSCADVIPTFLGFLAVVLEEVKPERTVFMDCDAAVHAVREFTAYDELPDAVPATGYGGTSMAPIWDKAEEMQLEPVCAIILTDCCMTERDFGEPQPFPVLWLSSEPGSSIPWGEYADLR